MSNISRRGDGRSKFYNYTTYIENKKREDKHGKGIRRGDLNVIYICRNTHHDSLNILFVQFCKEKEKIALKCINFSSYNSAVNAYGTFCNLNEHSMRARKPHPVP